MKLLLVLNIILLGSSCSIMAPSPEKVARFNKKGNTLIYLAQKRKEGPRKILQQTSEIFDLGIEILAEFKQQKEQCSHLLEKLINNTEHYKDFTLKQFAIQFLDKIDHKEDPDCYHSKEFYFYLLKTYLVAKHAPHERKTSQTISKSMEQTLLHLAHLWSEEEKLF